MTSKESVKIVLAVVLIIFLSSVISAGFFSELFGKITGKATSNIGQNISVSGGNAPQIIKLFNNSIESGVTLGDGPSNTNISVNFTVYDADGIVNILDASATLNISKAGETTRYNYSCTKKGADGNYANFSCMVMLWWFDDDGAWSIGANISDINSNVAKNASTVITINPLTGFSMGPQNLSWSTLAPATYNQTPANTPIVLNNTGNQDFDAGNVKMNSTHLYGERDNAKIITSGNFTVSNQTEGTTECHLGSYTAGYATQMNVTSGASYTALRGANMSRGNFSINDKLRGQEELYVCLTQVGAELTSQPYSTSQAGAWTLQLT